MRVDKRDPPCPRSVYRERIFQGILKSELSLRCGAEIRGNKRRSKKDPGGSAREVFSDFSSHLLAIYFREAFSRVTLSSGRDTEDDYSLDSLIAKSRSWRRELRARERACGAENFTFFLDPPPTFGGILIPGIKAPEDYVAFATIGTPGISSTV